MVIRQWREGIGALMDDKQPAVRSGSSQKRVGRVRVDRAELSFVFPENQEGRAGGDPMIYL